MTRAQAFRRAMGLADRIEGRVIVFYSFCKQQGRSSNQRYSYTIYGTEAHARIVERGDAEIAGVLPGGEVPADWSDFQMPPPRRPTTTTR